MKKSHLLLLLATILTFNACGSDDDNELLNSAEGIWRVKSLELGSEYDFNGDGIATNNLLSETDCLNGIFTFSNDGNGLYFIESLNIELIVDPVTNEAEYSIVCIDNSPFSQSFSWLQHESSISLRIDGEEHFVGTISGNKMAFLLDEPYIVEVYNGNTIDEVEETITLILQKDE